MLRSSLRHLNPSVIAEYFGKCSFSKIASEKASAIQSNEQQAPYYTAKDVEFCPNRAKDVMQNYVQETSDVCDGKSSEGLKTDSATQNERDHIEGYQPGPTVSLYCVMQSNVPEPYTTKDKAPTHLNMPGSSNTQDYKYLSGKMQTVHQSEQ